MEEIETVLIRRILRTDNHRKGLVDVVVIKMTVDAVLFQPTFLEIFDINQDSFAMKSHLY
jgi:hypothetical protein